MDGSKNDETAREIARNAMSVARDALETARASIARVDGHESACNERMDRILGAIGRIEGSMAEIWSAVDDLRKTERTEALEDRDGQIRYLKWICGGLGLVVLALVGWLFA